MAAIKVVEEKKNKYLSCYLYKYALETNCLRTYKYSFQLFNYNCIFNRTHVKLIQIYLEMCYKL